MGGRLVGQPAVTNPPDGPAGTSPREAEKAESKPPTLNTADSSKMAVEEELRRPGLVASLASDDKSRAAVEEELRRLGSVASLASDDKSRATPPPKPVPPNTPTISVLTPSLLQVVVRFTVREEDKDGPPVPDVQVELVHRAREGATPTSLGRGVSDEGGAVRLHLALGADQRDSGQFRRGAAPRGPTSGRCPASPALPRGTYSSVTHPPSPSRQ